MARRAVFLPRALGLSVVMALLSTVIALGSARSDVKRDLAAQLPDRLSEAFRYSLADTDIISHVEQQLREDLQRIQIDGLLPVLRSCRISLQRLTQEHPAPETGSAFYQSLSIPWQRGLQGDQADFLLQCELDIPVLVGTHLLMALLLMSSWSLMPGPLSRREQGLYDALLSCGLRAVEARNVVQSLATGNSDDNEIPDPWLMLAMRAYAQNRLSLAAALDIAQASPTLCFNHHSQCVVIHGISITLPKTPYFYYAWYASQRHQDIQHGWILNPAVDRPERAMANALIRLMENYGGHQKAINDLREHGLRSKILDQNRNKIKDELSAALGEDLAAGFLFETERDARSGRYRYRLVCSPEQILLQQKTPCEPLASL